MSKKLFVGGLSWDTTDQSLRAAFEAFGPVREARVILDRETGRSRGFGFVTFDDAAAAGEAVAKMNGAMLDGRTIRVNEAEERRGGGGGGGGGPRRGGYGGDRGGPEVHTRGARGPSSYGRRDRTSGPGGGGGGGGGGGYSPAPNFPPAGPPPGFAGEEAGWEEDRGRRDPTKKSKKKNNGQKEDEFRSRAATTKKRRRESGRTWRDYDMEEDVEAPVDEGDDFEFG